MSSNNVSNRDATNSKFDNKTIHKTLLKSLYSFSTSFGHKLSYLLNPFRNKNNNTRQNNADSLETTQRLKIFYYLSLCNKLLGSILVLLVITWTLKYRRGFFSNDFNWHPLFMICGMVFVYSRAMLFYRIERTIGMPRLKVMYARLIIGALIFVIIGLIAGLSVNEIAESVKSQECYFCIFTWHAWIGGITVILFFCQCMGDLYFYLHPVINQNRNATEKSCSFYLSAVILVGAITSSILGFYEVDHYFANQLAGDYDESETTFLWFIYAILMAIGGLSLCLFSRDCYKRLERPEDNDSLSRKDIFKHLCCIPWNFHECTYSLRRIFSKDIPNVDN